MMDKMKDNNYYALVFIIIFSMLFGGFIGMTICLLKFGNVITPDIIATTPIKTIVSPEKTIIIPEVRESDSEPPPGFKIVTNGVDHTFLYPNGRKSVFSYESKEEALSRAWGTYSIIQKDEATKYLKWEEVK